MNEKSIDIIQNLLCSIINEEIVGITNITFHLSYNRGSFWFTKNLVRHEISIKNYCYKLIYYIIDYNNPCSELTTKYFKDNSIIEYINNL